MEKLDWNRTAVNRAEGRGICGSISLELRKLSQVRDRQLSEVIVRVEALANAVEGCEGTEDKGERWGELERDVRADGEEGLPKNGAARGPFRLVSARVKANHFVILII